MAEFSGKVVSAVFADAEYQQIKIRYEQDGVLYVYTVPNDDNNVDFQELLKEGWDVEKIIEETAEINKMQSRAFNEQIHQAARAMVDEKLKELDAKIEVQGRVNALESTEALYSIIVNNTDKDELFRFKLWALELDFVKASTKDKKSELRKAKTLLEGCALLHSMK